MPGLLEAVNTALANSVVSQQEWDSSVKTAWNEAVKDNKTDEIQAALKLIADNSAHVVMPTVLREMHQNLPENFSGQELLNLVSENSAWQMSVAGFFYRSDKNGNGLEEEELIEAFQGLKFLFLQGSLLLSDLQGGALLYVAESIEQRRYIDSESIRYFESPYNLKDDQPEGLNLNSKLISEFRDLGIEKPKPHKSRNPRSKPVSDDALDFLYGGKKR